MASIIHAPALSAVSRQLRRPGALADALLVVDPLAPAGQPSAVEPFPTAAPLQADTLALQAQQLRDDAEQLRRQQQALAAAQAELAVQQVELAQREQQLQAGLQQMNEQAVGVLADAERRGFALGQESGEREALEAALAHSERLNTVVHALTQVRCAALDDNQDMLVEIVFTAVCRLLGMHAATREGVASMVRQMIAREREPDKVTVRLHPHDARQFDVGGGQVVPGVAFVADAGIELGGCIVDGPRGTLDARLELQLQHLRAALTQARVQQEQAEEAV